MSQNLYPNDFESRFRKIAASYEKEAEEWRKEAERLEKLREEALHNAEIYEEAAEQFRYVLENQTHEKETIL